MSKMSMKVLEIIIENSAKPVEEIINAVCRAFPCESYALLEGYIYQLGKDKYLSVQSGDNRIVGIFVNPSAYVALREVKDAPAEKASTQVNIGSIGNISGQFAVGNKGGSYDMHVSNVVIHEMSNGLKEVLTLADKQSLNPFELEQIKKITRQIFESLDKSEPPPQSLIKQFDSFMQKHSWIAAPLATAFLNVLAKFFH